MLSKEHQEMLIFMLETPMTFENNNSYNNRRSFNRAVAYLFENGLVWKKDGKFILSYKGEMLSKILASFSEVNEEIRTRFGLGL